MVRLDSLAPAVLCLALLGVSAGWNAHAADPPTAAEEDSPAIAAEVPDPRQLDPGWWQHFAQAGDQLPARVQALTKRFAALGTELGADPVAETARPLIAQVSELINRYVQARAKKTAPGKPVPPSKETYTISDFLDLASTELEERSSAALNREEYQRDSAALDKAERRLADALGAYREVATAAPEKIISGLEIMRRRLVWAVGRENLRVRNARLTEQEERAKLLSAELARASTVLHADEKHVKLWLDKLTASEDALKALTAKADAARLHGNLFADDAEGTARRKHHLQKLLGFEVAERNLELDAQLDRTAAALAADLAASSEKTVEQLRLARGQITELSRTLASQVQEWRKATDWERSSASARLGDSDAVLTQVHRWRIEQADQTAAVLLRVDRQLGAANALAGAVGRHLLDSEGQLADWWASTVELSTRFFSTLGSWSTYSLFTVNDSPVTALGLLRLSVILLVAWWISRIVRHAIERLGARRESANQAAYYTVNRIFHYVILMVGFLVALSSIGIDLTKFALVASAFGVGLGFGLQAIFSNFVAGLIILFERSLKVGDFVELESGVNGEVRGINIRSTMITTNDNVDILVPNSEFVNGRVTNWTLRDTVRRIRVPFGVAYGTDKDLVKRAVLAAALEVPFTLQADGRQPQVWLVGFGDSSLDFELVVWLTSEAVKRPSAVHAAYTWSIETALGSHDIEIPFPQRDLHIRSWKAPVTLASTD